MTEYTSCEECKNRIDDTDVEGHYSGECAHCRMSPQTHKQDRDDQPSDGMYQYYREQGYVTEDEWAPSTKKEREERAARIRRTNG